MSDPHSEKVFPATNRKRQQARENGQVVISPDLLAGVFLLTVTTVLHFCGHQVVDHSASYLQGSFEQIQLESFESPSQLSDHFVEQFSLSALYFLKKLWPFWALTLIAVVTVFAQTRGLIHWTAITPDLNRINPASGINKFSFAEMSQRMLATSVKLTGLSFVAWTCAVKHHELNSKHSLARLAQAEIDQVISFLFVMSAGLLIWGTVDYFWRRLRFEKQLRMSARELAEEQKQFDPDPNVRQGSERLREKLTTGISLNRETDLLITNGMTESVLLRYQPSLHSGPMILSRESGSAGVLLLQRCMQSQTQIHESMEIQRKLFQTRDSILPENLWPEIAQIFAKRSSQTVATVTQAEPQQSTRVG